MVPSIKLDYLNLIAILWLNYKELKLCLMIKTFLIMRNTLIKLYNMLKNTLLKEMLNCKFLLVTEEQTL